MEKDNFKDCIPNDKKGYIDGSCFISPKLLLVFSGEVIESNTDEEYRAYIEENNLEEGDYKDCSTGMFFHIKYKTSFKPDMFINITSLRNRGKI